MHEFRRLWTKTSPILSTQKTNPNYVAVGGWAPGPAAGPLASLQLPSASPRPARGPAAGRGAHPPMTRITDLFTRLKDQNRKALIAYITAGDPSPDRTPALVEALERGGADLIELGVPFSDPIADGPVIQRGSERALKAGTTVATVLDIASRIRQQSEIPLLLFTYMN